MSSQEISPAPPPVIPLPSQPSPVVIKNQPPRSPPTTKDPEIQFPEIKNLNIESPEGNLTIEEESKDEKVPIKKKSYGPQGDITFWFIVGLMVPVFVIIIFYFISTNNDSSKKFWNSIFSIED